MQPRPDRPHRATQYPRRLSITQLVQLAQHDHLAISPGQRLNGTAKGADLLGARQIPFDFLVRDQMLWRAPVLAALFADWRMQPTPLQVPPHQASRDPV